MLTRLCSTRHYKMSLPLTLVVALQIQAVLAYSFSPCFVFTRYQHPHKPNLQQSEQIARMKMLALGQTPTKQTIQRFAESGSCWRYEAHDAHTPKRKQVKVCLFPLKKSPWMSSSSDCTTTQGGVRAPLVAIVACICV